MREIREAKPGESAKGRGTLCGVVLGDPRVIVELHEAQSAHGPFGLVGLEAMAVGGLACTGATGEDYAVPGRNAIVLETGDPGELLGWLERLRERPEQGRSIRRAGRSTARNGPCST